MKNGWPTKYDRNSTHAHFGVEVWMKKIGVVNHELQQSLINDFLKDNGFVIDESKGKRATHRMKSVFISNRFEKFRQFVFKNTAQVKAV
jgi:hypothetical protein